jgi:hypothetical protein
MGLLILFGRIGERGGLPIARAKTPNLPAKEAGTPVLGSPYPTTKASCQVLPGGLEKIPHILEIFFFDILLPLLYIRLILKQVLIISVQALFAISKGITLQHFIQRKPAANSQAPANPSTLECSEGLAEVEN